MSEVKNVQAVAEISGDDAPTWAAVDLANSRRIAKPKLPAPVKTVKKVPDPEPAAIPRPSAVKSHSTGGSVYVRGYYRKDGTYVKPHSRKK